jgi:hypothetical protein
MMEIDNISVWTKRETGQIFVVPFKMHTEDGVEFYGRPRDHGIEGFWTDPLGAAYMDWRKATDNERVLLMLETAIDLAMNGFDLGDVLREFAKVRQFRELGDKSYPICRALTKAIIGKCCEPNTMRFEELLKTFA